MSDTTINPDEIAKFTRMAEEWWDPKGKFKPLHKFNPVRLAYIRETALRRFGRDGHERRPLEGLRVLDIGCGGGLLCEPLARLGASVTGIDPAERNIAVARLHAEQSGLAIDYRAETAEAIAASGAKFDIVLNMEVVEHVDNVPLFMKSASDMVAPGGMMLVATINRTARAYALAIVGPEYVLRWLPRGTHDWKKFLTPDEISALVTRNGLRVAETLGVVYHPLEDAWKKSTDTGVNYMLLAERE
ncbi:MAG: bifunctional 2-polyprenyl-6-hydroxyphenol methylase/3-demethylubiquinol 3-O-methyltransferase UbiG [Devosia sp.]